MISLFRMEGGEVESCRAEEYSNKIASKLCVSKASTEWG